MEGDDIDFLDGECLRSRLLEFAVHLVNNLFMPV